MEPLFIIALSSVAVSLLTELSKLTKVAPQVIVIALSLLLGVCYQAFRVWVPEVMQIQIQDFVAGTMAGSVFLYEFFIKKIQPSK